MTVKDTVTTLLRPGLLLLVAALLSYSATPVVFAQEETSGEESAEEESDSATPESARIEPYTGPPIFLHAVETPPPPKELEAKTMKLDHPGTDKPMFERRMVRFSDDSYKSDGPHKEYFSNGQVYVEGEFDMGRPTGKWTYFHENGEIAKQVEYVEGRPHGEVTIMSDEGKLLNKRSYKNGLRHGKWIKYSLESDQPLLEQLYTEGKPDGIWKTWFQNGQLRQEVSFKEGVRDGLAKEWTSGGEQRLEANFKEGKQHGTTTVWRRDGQVIKQTFEEGKLLKQDDGSDE